MSRMDRHRQKPEKKEVFIEPSKVSKIKTHKKKPWWKRIVWTILLVIGLLLGYSIISFIIGSYQATHDQSIPQMDIEDFTGDAIVGKSINILLIGSDSRGEDQGRSDSLMIAHYNSKTGTPKLVSLMRDTYVNIPEFGYNKLNAAYSFGGAELVKETVNNNFGVPIHYYAIVNFESFPKIIDTLFPNGLEVDAEKDLDLDGTFIKQGPQRMNGIEVLQYSRFRKDDESDFGRVRRQQQVMNDILQQTLDMRNILNLPLALGKVQGYTTTNLPSSFYLTVSKDLLFGKLKPLEKMTIPVDGSWWDGYYEDAGSVLEIDEAENAQALQNFLSD